MLTPDALHSPSSGYDERSGLEGHLAALARSLSERSPARCALRQTLLRGLSADLALHSIHWLGGEPGSQWACWPPAPRSLQAAVDWPQFEALPAGRVRWIEPADRARRPRLAAGSGSEVWVKPTSPGGSRCGLRLTAGTQVSLSDSALVALADLILALVQEDGRRAGESQANSERRLGRRAAALGHDLRNQLSLASLELERLIEGQLTPAFSEELRRVATALAEARAMCAAAARVHGHTPRRAVFLRPVLLEAAGKVRALPPSHREVRVFVRCAPELAALTNAVLLGRAVENLILNAVEASPDSSEVRISAFSATEGVVVEVLDHGKGMGGEGQQRFQEPGRSGGGGTGFGTESLRECVEALGARLEVESRPAAGTRARVLLPAAHGHGSPVLALLDGDARRRGRRAAHLRRAGMRVLAAAAPGEVQSLVGNPALAGVLLARGLCAEGVPELLGSCRRHGVPFELMDARDADALEGAGKLGVPG